jgi:enamine deaminase RidA (YjgF/YER057c/UK114 family)
MKRHLVLVVGASLLACATPSASGPTAPTFTNPPGLGKPNGYSHVVEVYSGPTLYVAGQVARDANGNVVGRGDMRAQAEQVFRNIQTALEARAATLADIVQLTCYIRDMSQLAAYREVRERVLGAAPRPASTLVGVSALASEDFLLEVDVIAAPRR